MQVGDLVRLRYIKMGVGGDLGIIIDGPESAEFDPLMPSYKIWWMALNKTGWWDAHRLEKIK